MAKSDNQSVKNGIIATVVGGLILSAGGYALYAAPNTFKWIVRAFTSMWRYATSSTYIPNWLLWLLVVLSLIAVVRLIRPLLKRADNTEPTFKMYTEDVFEGVTWRWSYDWYDLPTAIIPHCLTCGAILVHINEAYRLGPATSVSFYCERCKQVRAEIIGGDRNYAESMIGRLIELNIRNGEWKRVIQRNGLIEGAN